MPGRDRRRLQQMYDVEPSRSDSPSGTTVGVVMAIAVCAGLAWGLSSAGSGAGGADKPILWDEVQALPKAAADAADAEWVARAGDDAVIASASDAIQERAGVPLRSAARNDGIAFGFCHTGGGTNCVVDGDTFYLAGQKVRIADIDAPETHDYGCPAELARGQQATRRLQQLLSSGAIRMASIDRDTDSYGRKLRTVEVDGTGVGEALVGEGLARWYEGGRRSWC